MATNAYMSFPNAYYPGTGETSEPHRTGFPSGNDPLYDELDRLGQIAIPSGQAAHFNDQDLDTLTLPLNEGPFAVGILPSQHSFRHGQYASQTRCSPLDPQRDSYMNRDERSSVTVSDSAYASFKGPIKEQEAAASPLPADELDFVDDSTCAGQRLGTIASESLVIHQGQAWQNIPEVQAPRHGRARPTPSVCQLCSKSLKNASEAHKHAHIHEKPFWCTEIGCQKRFATNNDLERHRGSVHGLMPRVGKSNGYVCQMCPPPHGGRPKFWPRKDNFKAHIRRKHPQNDLEQLMRFSETVRPQNAFTADTGCVSGPASQADALDLGSAQMAWPLMDSEPASQGFLHRDLPFDYGGAMQGDTLAGIGSGALPGFTGYTGAVLMADTHQLANTMFDQGTSVTRYSGAESLSLTTVPSHGQPDWYQTGQTTHPSPYYMTVPDQAIPDPNRLFTCRSCPKTTTRECDLRKHEKRHSRPYPCTFPHCNKRFGSRNDWKRHESSQHEDEAPEAEMWVCDFPNGTSINGSQSCGEVAHNEEVMLEHLRTTHLPRAPPQELTSHLPRLHIPANANTDTPGHSTGNGPAKFWCGYCRSFIALARHGNGTDMFRGDTGVAVSRSRHMGDHFDKGEWRMREWVCLEAGRARGLLGEGGEHGGGEGQMTGRGCEWVAGMTGRGHEGNFEIDDDDDRNLIPSDSGFPGTTGLLPWTAEAQGQIPLPDNEAVSFLACAGSTGTRRGAGSADDDDEDEMSE
ncbi:hypothetical protein LTR62_005106 [Meristemomyces frigidus]|uniref:C2H2-type domain-containing protein n=1 Tax=Meristemomyces frigidus TaxID=1508187 RepID=A0AAN7TPT6_9PEZI|nr:hypothetical protein LTR62_005106 [Meristemomyces frigidus]